MKAAIFRQLGPDWARTALLTTAFLAVACTGGDIDYDHRVAGPPEQKAVKLDKAGKPIPIAADVTAPVAAPDYRPSALESAMWADKLKSGKDFNDVKIQATVVTAPTKAADKVRIEPDRLCFPIEGNTDLLKLKPGAPFIGQPASDKSRAAGKSNNVLGFLRKVKEVK